MPVDKTENWLHVVVVDVDKFDADSIRTVWLDQEIGINSKQGKLADGGDDAEMVVQSLMFDVEQWTEDGAIAWTEENYPDAEALTDEDSDKVDANRKRYLNRAKLAMVHARKFEETPGTPKNADEPKLDEGMESFRAKVVEAIEANGWNAWSTPNAPYDFWVMELFTNVAILQDAFTGDFYKVAIAVDGDGNVTLGTPEKYEVVFVPVKDNAPAAHRVPGLRWIVAAEGKSKPGVYPVVMVSSGPTTDGRYFTADAIKDAVANNLFDGVKCFYQHPDFDGRRDDFPCAFIKTGTTRMIEGPGGVIDVVGDAVMFGTDPGRNMDNILATSIEHKEDLMECSIVASGPSSRDVIDGHRVIVYTKLDTIDAVDFVDFGACPRTGLIDKVAASKQTKGDAMEKTKEELQKELDAANAKAEKLEAAEAKVAQLEWEKAVDALLAESSLPDELRKVHRPIMCDMSHDEDKAKTYLDGQEKTYYASATRKGGTPTDDDDGSDDTTPDLKDNSAVVQMQRAMTVAGLEMDESRIKAARGKVYATTGR